MNEFRFNCPSCGQHILVSGEWSGRVIKCPSCNTQMTIPPPPREQKRGEAKGPAKAPGGAKAAAGPGTPTSPRASGATGPAAAGTASTKPQKGVNRDVDRTAAPSLTTSTNAGQPQRLRVAVLTPEVKLEMVRAVRGRIENESSWLAGLKDAKEIFAAKQADGRTVSVAPRDPSATRFSLIGAFLREFWERNVARTATGRTKLLDKEIPDAIRDVLLDEMDDEQREQTPDPLVTNNPLSISHAQCLAALDVLEERYSQRMEQLRTEKVKRRLGNTRLSDLVMKLEKKAKIAPEDVATAMFHEFMEIRRRLDQLERAREGQKSVK